MAHDICMFDQPHTLSQKVANNYYTSHHLGAHPYTSTFSTQENDQKKYEQRQKYTIYQDNGSILHLDHADITISSLYRCFFRPLLCS